MLMNGMITVSKEKTSENLQQGLAFKVIMVLV